MLAAAALLLSLAVCAPLPLAPACAQDQESAVDLLPPAVVGEARIEQRPVGSAADAAPQDGSVLRLAPGLPAPGLPAPGLPGGAAVVDELIPPPPLPAAAETKFERLPLPDDAESLEAFVDDDNDLPACADGCPVRPQDELWYVSSRHLGCVCPQRACPQDVCKSAARQVNVYQVGEAPDLRVWHYDRLSGQNVPSSLDEFFAADDPGVITCIYVHGARVPEYRAFARLPLVYRALTCDLPPEVRVRMVLFSWPNPKSARVLKDFRRASAGAPPHSRNLGWLVSRIDPRVKVSLLSFSLGAQLVTGALNAMACGGCGDGDDPLPHRAISRHVLQSDEDRADVALADVALADVALADVTPADVTPEDVTPADNALADDSPPREELPAAGIPGCCPRRRVRVVMWTAAVDDHWILPGHVHGCAVESVDRMLLVTNLCDPILKHFRWMNPGGSPQALGYTGLVHAEQLGPAVARIEQIDAGCWLGRTHAYRRHINSPDVIGVTQPYLFWCDVGM